MKKTILFCAAAIALFAVGCSKSSDNKTTNPPASTTGSVTINGSTLNETAGKDTATTDFFGAAGNLLGAYQSANGKYSNTYLLFKNTGRPSAGSYNIGGTVNYWGANQVLLLVFDSSAAGNGLYGNDSVTTVNLNLSLTSGILTATIPSIRLSGLFTPAGGGSTYNETITFSGTIVE